MTPFNSDQWVMLALFFSLGLFLGMFLMAGGKWKRRYREEVRRGEELQREHDRFLSKHRDTDSLRHTTSGAPVADRRGPL